MLFNHSTSFSLPFSLFSLLVVFSFLGGEKNVATAFIPITSTTTTTTIITTNSGYAGRQEALDGLIRCNMVGLNKMMKKKKKSGSSAEKQVRLGKNNNKANGISSSETSSSYVPSGLSYEQYQQLKKDEKLKLEKMNFGAFGPRFQQVDTPTGDWMVVPSLWTHGFNANSGNRKNGGVLVGNPNSKRRKVQRKLYDMTRFMKPYIPSFLLGYILLDLLLTGVALSKVPHKKLTYNVAFHMITKMSLLNMKQMTISIPLLLTNVMTIVSQMNWWKIQFLKVSVVSLVTPIIENRYIEYMNRKHLWDKRRTILTTLGVCIGVLLSYTTILAQFF